MRWIERLMKRGGSVRQYSELSENWETCLIGEVRKDFPTVVVGRKLLFSEETTAAPKDFELHELGTRFNEEIYRGHRNRALQTYDKVQKRVRQLMAAQYR
jgi:hypothetical protein